MSQNLTLNIDTSIASVVPVGKSTLSDLTMDETPMVSGVSGAERENLLQLSQALSAAINEFKRLNEDVFNSHREQIARLSVGIAEKILQKEIAEGQYNIEKIVQESLKTAPSQQDVSIRLNPDDLQQFQQILKDEGSDIPFGAKLLPDANIGPAQCIIETDKGMIEHLIDKHLAQITEALKTGGNE